MKKKPLVSLLLDSGAFSAWTRNEVINMKDYIAFIKRNSHLLDSYVSIDVIPGKHGVARTQRQVEESAAASYKNHQRMKDAGLTPIPVFHQGENWRWLEKYLDDGETYIGISAFKDVPMAVQRSWLDECFTIMSNKKGQPYCKVHGFAITNHPLFVRYPWWTVDSTTWSLGAGYGHVLVPPQVKCGDGYKSDYMQPAEQVVMSGVTQKGSNQRVQYEGMGAVYKLPPGKERTEVENAIYNYIVNVLGVNPTDARNDTGGRRRAFLIYFMECAKNISIPCFTHRVGRLQKYVPPGKPLKHDWHPTIMFATNFRNKAWGQLMTDVGANTRLVSYYEIMDISTEQLEQYVTTGMFDDYKKQTPSLNMGNGYWNSPSLQKKGNKNETYLNFRRLQLARKRRRGDDDDQTRGLVGEAGVGGTGTG